MNYPQIVQRHKNSFQLSWWINICQSKTLNIPKEMDVFYENVRTKAFKKANVQVFKGFKRIPAKAKVINQVCKICPLKTEREKKNQLKRNLFLIASYKDIYI